MIALEPAGCLLEESGDTPVSLSLFRRGAWRGAEGERFSQESAERVGTYHGTHHGKYCAFPPG